MSSSLVLPTPLDNPALHQGRVRAVPHVEGQYATYVYVPLVLHRHHPLYALLEGALSSAIPQVPSLHPIGKQEHDDAKSARWELHISLSHPLFLRAHQREEFKRAIMRLASSVAPYVLPLHYERPNLMTTFFRLRAASMHRLLPSQNLQTMKEPELFWLCK